MLHSLDVSLPAGTRLSHFEISGLIGAGGMGEVYRARDLKLHRDVALKTLPPEVAASADRLRRFDREARAVAALNHPNIVTIYSIEEADGIHFQTMELVDGASLEALMPSAGMPVPRLFEIALALTDALAAAHERGIVHRDLKPANVMVDAAGRVKVLDFGLARTAIHDATADDESATHLATKAGSIVGTVPYMSPEQIEGRPADARSDVFSLGVMLYELATGARPFVGSSSPVLMSAILRDSPPAITERRPDLPEHLARVVRRCLEKAPIDRYQSMRELQRELRDLQKETETSSTRRPSTGSSAVHRPRPSLWVAVLPFTAPPGDDETSAFAEGLVEDITAGLGRFKYLSVVARSSTLRLGEQRLDARSAAHQLGARYLLEGSLRRSGPTVRTKVQLIDAQTGAQLWAETYTRDLETADVFSVQDDVTDRVVATVADVHGVLMHSMLHSVRDVPIEHLGPHELMLRYWRYHQQPQREEHARLRQALEAMVEGLPHDPELWAALANMYFHEYSHWFNPLEDPLGRARQAARRSIELDPAGQLGWEALAVTFFFDRDVDGFHLAVDRAISLNPRNTNSLAWMALLLAHHAEYDRAYALVTRAMTLNPHHPGWYHVVMVDWHCARGELNEALAAARRINTPDLVWMHLLLANLNGLLGRREEARTALHTLRGLEPTFAHEAAVQEATARWFWQPELVAGMMDAYRKAVACLAEEGRAS